MSSCATQTLRQPSRGWLWATQNPLRGLTRGCAGLRVKRKVVGLLSAASVGRAVGGHRVGDDGAHGEYAQLRRIQRALPDGGPFQCPSSARWASRLTETVRTRDSARSGGLRWTAL